MAQRWLNVYMRLSGTLFELKQKVVNSQSILKSIAYVFAVVGLEIAFVIVSLPLFLTISPKKLQERGFIIPQNEKDAAPIQSYIVRRKLGLVTFASAAAVLIVKFFVISAISAYLFGIQPLLADTFDWTMTTAGDFTYDNAKIDVTGGVAKLKNLSASGSTTNSGFDTNATGWTYIPWLSPTSTTNGGTYVSAGGNPGGYVKIDLTSSKRNKTVAGYYQQAFTTTVANPASATVNLDWKSLIYTSPTPATTFQVYVFIESSSGHPIVTQNVWGSGEITSTTNWAGSGPINIASKLGAAGTYYVDVAVYAQSPNVDTSYAYSAAVDGISLNWSQTAAPTYSATNPTITPTTSLNPATVSSWNSFTETATKNGGEINYQLSDDDGVTWKYWSGSAWATAGASNYNTASVVNTNITSFSAATKKIRWKAFLVSNGSQQVILDNVTVGYTLNAPPTVTSLSPSQGSSTGRVYVNYNLVDANSDSSSLVAYKYSLTGAFAGEEVAMTAVTGDPLHSGVTSLTTSPTGIAHTFVWDAFSQLGATYRGTVYVRLQANDGITSGAAATSASFPVDYVVPVVSNVTAAQTSGTTNVVFTYDLADNTSTGLLTELDISNDAGVTWTVAKAAVSGSIGSSQTTGTGKTITWNAGTDYDEHAQANMRVRIRAKDTFQNQGTYVSSANFTLDTLNPTVNVAANLQSQLNAGDTTVLIGGSFTETNPNTNDFYLAVDGGAYGSSTSGTINTATPSNQATAVGATLDGNDYISKLKIIHTDDFGQATTNENLSPSTSFKYVKPYTPAAPTLSNPVTNRLDVTVNPNASETSGLEYAVFETSQSKYVQADGTLGASAVWEALGTGSGQWGNNTGISGKVRVSGLTSPVANYIFKVKSRNSSDAGHATSSESAFSSTAQITNTAPAITLGSIAQTTDGTNYVTINYTGTDAQSDLNNLSQFEYSLDNSVWATMTEKSGVGSEGTTNLVFAAAGSAHVFKWNVGIDVPNLEDSTVFTRLKSTDTLLSSSLVTSSSFEVDTKSPVVSAVSVSQNAGAKTVAITYTLTDAHNSAVVLEISNDGGATWTVPVTSATGNVGAGVTPGSKTITWNAGIDFAGQYNTTMKVRLSATDTFGHGGSATSSAFTVDTRAPVISNISAVQNSGASTFSFTYDVSENSGNVNVGLEISSDGAVTWTVPTTSATGSVGSGVVPGTGKTISWNGATDLTGQEKTAMQMRLTGTDTFSNAATVTSTNFSLDTLAPRVTSVAATQTAGSTAVIITYTLADQNNSTVALDISNDGGTTWTVTNTSVSGDVGSGIAGGSKTITWNAGTDYDEHAQANMRVRVRANDIFNNQSANTQSSNFSLDTLNPATNVTADLQSQPNAGDTTVLIGGSFTETNPNTNDFSVAIDGGAHGSSTSGTTNTATPANQSTAVGATLDGNDYISKVKIVHTDDFGQSTTNENVSPATSFKYVKPYTPAAPTVDNPTVGTVDVTINKYSTETDGLEYAVFETSQSKYVQADGTLGASPVWEVLGTGSGQWGNNTSVSGKVRVNGLAAASYLYQFEIKSRNPSDAGHAASSESALSSGGSSANQSPTITLGVVAQTSGATQYVTVNYSATDLESGNVHLVKVEYSTDNSTWFTMTEKSGVGSQGTSGLLTSSTGIAHQFMWNVAADLPTIEDATVYVRLQANDGTTDGGVATSGAFAIDVKDPVISTVTANQITGSGNVQIMYDLSDISSNTVVLEISEDGGTTWTVPTTSSTGDVGLVVSPGTGKTIIWNALTDFSNQDQTDLQVRVRATDNFGNAGSFAMSANFSVDTTAPALSTVTAAQTAGSGNVTIHYDLAETNSSSVTIEISGDNGSTWTIPTTSLSGAVGSGVASGLGKTVAWNAATDFSNNEQAGMKVRVRAVDTYANVSGNVSSGSFVVDTLAPRVTTVSASQTTGTDTVVFSYDLADANSTDVALDISNDGGATWTVTDSSVSGSVGSGIAAGNGKTISWNVATDFPNQEVATMRVRIRGTDSFANASSNVQSTDYTVDTQAPAVATTTNLQSQPNAGDTTVLIGGSFTETNPNTNDFSVAIDGGAYGSATSGTTNTATPSNQATAIGATLDGNDYISKVKTVHVDDYGHSATNENTALDASVSYVKPYTPSTLTVSNPQNTSVDVAVNENPAEVGGLDYAILEDITGKYVQGNGSLGTSPVWQTAATWGVKTVAGLSSPVAHYSFKVKSRNASDTSHAASSESNLSAAASIPNTSASITVTSAVQQSSGNYATITYTGTDTQNDTNTIIAAEYSTNGTTWQSLTEKTGVGSEGTTNLLFTAAGSSHVLAWDVAADLPNAEFSAVRVRLQTNDGLADSNLATSSAFAIDTKGPVISNTSIGQTPGTGNIVVSYDMADNSGSNNTVTFEVSSDGGATWTVPVTSAAGDVGANVSAGAARQITWNAGTDFSGQEQSNMQVRLRGLDQYGNLGDFEQSTNFTVDTKNPVVSAVSATQTTGSQQVSISYTLSDAAPGGQFVEFQISEDGGSTWTVAGVTVAGAIGSGQTTGANTFTWNAGTDFAGRQETDMQVQVRALDYFGNQGSYTHSANFSVDTSAPVVSALSATQTTSTQTVVIPYDLSETSGPTTIELQISSDGGSTWAVDTTSATGDLGAAVTSGTGKSISWNAGADFAVEEQSAMRVRLLATDNFGNISSYFESTDFSVDTASPLGLTGLTTFATTSTSATLHWQAVTDAHFDHFELWHGATESDVQNRTGTAAKWSVADDSGLNLNSTTFTAITGIILTNNYYVQIWAVDAYGNETTVSDINVFTPAPVITVPSTPVLKTLASPTNTATVIISGIADPGTFIDLYDNNVLVARLDVVVDGSGHFSQTFTFSEGDHQFTAKSVDTGNNVSALSDAVSLTIDLTAPAAPIILQPQSGDVVSSTPTLIGVTEPFATLEIILDNGQIFSATADADGAWQFILPANSALAIGEHTFAVRATDLAGNQSDVTTLTVVVPGPVTDTSAPVVTTLSAQQTVGTRQVVMQYDLSEVSGPSTVELQISSDGGSTWVVSHTAITGDLGSGVVSGTGKSMLWDAGADFSGQDQAAMRFRLQATDSFGNQSTFVESPDFSVDTTAPLGLTTLSTFATTATSATLHWQAVTDSHFDHFELWHGATESDVQNRTGTAQQWGTVNDSQLALNTATFTVITGLNLTGNYYVKIWAVDQYGNEATVNDVNVFTPVVQPVTGPNKPILNTLKTPTNSASVIISGIADPGAFIDLYDNGVFVARLNLAADQVGKFSQIFTFSEGDHIFTLKAVDATGNQSDFSNSVSLTIDLTAPAAPVISQPQDGSTTSSTPTLIGTTEPFATIEIILDGGQTFTTTADGNGNWQFILPSGFALSVGDHTFAVQATDAAGNVGPATTIAVTVPTPTTTITTTPVVTPAATTAVITPSVPVTSTAILTQLSGATELAGIPAPKVVSVTPQVTGTTFTFSGTALPNEDVIVYVHSQQAVIYRTTANSAGIWTIQHSQDVIELSSGVHTIYAVGLDTNANVKSRPSPTVEFSVNKSFWVMLYNYLNLPTTIVVIVILVAVAGWLYKQSLKRAKKA